MPGRRLSWLAKNRIGVDDLVLLPSSECDERKITSQLKDRLEGGEVYTYIGHVLVAMNPFKWISGLYDEAMVARYERKNRIDVPPHVFAISEAAYRSMILEEEDQCIIISGESGAGKTECSKQIQNYIALVSGNSGHGVTEVKRIFIESNPVLEAFGNAKTLRNNNSSRFGKYFEMKFDPTGRPFGGLIHNYLLEKSRIVRPGPGERNFHIFYQLLAAASANPDNAMYTALKLNSEELRNPRNFSYLNISNCFTVEGIHDGEEFDITLNSMKAVGIKGKRMQGILRVIAAILHLGNIRMESALVKGADGSVIKNKSAIRNFCEIMNIEGNHDAIEYVLTHKTIEIMGAGKSKELHQVPQNPTQANAMRDALGKSMYEKMFDLILYQINHTLATKAPPNADEEVLYSIGVLDIYGFEIFETNGFEQFCINYVNEKLQQIFIELTLKSEQEEYAAQGIQWKPIKFFNNKVVCDLIEALRPTTGIFYILDDITKSIHGQDHGVDEKFLDSLSKVHKSNRHFRKANRAFEIEHYAGKVTYTASNFAKSNKDTLPLEIKTTICTSTNDFISRLFLEEVEQSQQQAALTNSSGGRSRNSGAPSMGMKIKKQCNELVAALMRCEPHYIRCIKPNDTRAPLTCVSQRVQHQVKYLGLKENIMVRRAGFAYRQEYARFFDRFRLLSSKTANSYGGTDRKGCEVVVKSIVKQLGLDPNKAKQEIQFGHSMIFIKHPETYFDIEGLLDQYYSWYATKIQRQLRMYFGRRRLLKLKKIMVEDMQRGGKLRRSGSILRPWDGIYLHQQEKDVNQCIKDILEYYQTDHRIKERVSFSDVCYKIEAPTSSNSNAIHDNSSLPFVRRIVIITNVAVYFMEDRGNTSITIDKEVKIVPRVFLKRRIPLSALNSISMSTLADDICVLHVNHVNLMSEPKKDHWLEDKDVKSCPITGSNFSLFNRRHHCRVSGGIFAHKACNYVQTAPDLGCYTPSRVADNVIGFESTDQLEDVVLWMERKTEFIALLQEAFEESRDTKKSLRVNYTNNINLEGGPTAALRLVPGIQLNFSELRSGRKKGNNRNSNRRNQQSSLVSGAGNIARELSQLDLDCEITRSGNDSVSIKVPPGIASDALDKIMVHREKRQAKKAKRRRKEAMRRQEERKKREAELEEERKRRVAEKKAKKAAKIEARIRKTTAV